MSLTRIEARDAIEDIRTEMFDSGSHADGNDGVLVNLVCDIVDQDHGEAPLDDVHANLHHLRLRDGHAERRIRDIVAQLEA